MDRSYSRLGRLGAAGVIGTDEVALKHGHRDFVALIVVPREGGGVEIRAVLADRKKETVMAFLLCRRLEIGGIDNPGHLSPRYTRLG
jgi:hypothetical protein